MDIIGILDPHEKLCGSETLFKTIGVQITFYKIIFDHLNSEDNSYISTVIMTLCAFYTYNFNDIYFTHLLSNLCL